MDACNESGGTGEAQAHTNTLQWEWLAYLLLVMPRILVVCMDAWSKILPRSANLTAGRHRVESFTLTRAPRHRYSTPHAMPRWSGERGAAARGGAGTRQLSAT